MNDRLLPNVKGSLPGELEQHLHHKDADENTRTIRLGLKGLTAEQYNIFKATVAKFMEKIRAKVQWRSRSKKGCIITFQTA